MTTICIKHLKTVFVIFIPCQNVAAKMEADTKRLFASGHMPVQQALTFDCTARAKEQNRDGAVEVVQA